MALGNEIVKEYRAQILTGSVGQTQAAMTSDSSYVSEVSATGHFFSDKLYLHN